jgi:molybdopterin-synthase adenylyltransferase
VVFHAHVHDGHPRLSEDDRRSAERLIPMFRARVPARPHGSVVLSRTHAGGLILMPDKPTSRSKIDVRWLGASIVDWKTALPNPSISEPLEFARQLLVVREDGQRALAHARVAVVGLGGGGSHVAQQLAHLGVGEVTCIDPDRASKTDRHRLLGLTRLDVWLHRKKTKIVRRVVRRIGLSRRCRTIDERVPGPTALDVLKTADVIVGCLDNLHARADLQELSWRFLIPYVDVGVNIRAIQDPEPNGPGVTIGGNVLTLIPGGFCMWCSGFLSKAKLDAELAGPNRNYFQNREGEAQVVSLNGVVASQAVTEVLQLLTGFGGSGLRRSQLALDAQPNLQRGFRKLDGVRGTLEDWGAPRRQDCPFCSSTLGAGGVAWTSPV